MVRLMPGFSFKIDNGAYETNFYGDLSRAIKDLKRRNEKVGRQVEVEETAPNRARFTIRYTNIDRTINGEIYCTMKTEKYPKPNVADLEKSVLKLLKQNVPETHMPNLLGVSASLIRQIIRGLIDANKVNKPRKGRP